MLHITPNASSQLLYKSSVNAWILVREYDDWYSCSLLASVLCSKQALIKQQRHIRHRQMADMHCQCPKVQLGHLAT